MQAEFDLTSGRITFSDPDITNLVIKDSMAWARYLTNTGAVRNVPITGIGSTIHEEVLSDVHGTGSRWKLHCLPNPDGIQLHYQINSYEKKSFLLLKISISNQSRQPIYLQDLCLFQASPSNRGQLIFGGATGSLRFFKAGWHAWDDTRWLNASDRLPSSWLDPLVGASYTNPATRKPDGQGEFCSEGWSILAGGKTALIVGLASSGRQFGQVYASLIAGHAALMLVTQADGIRIDPGESYDSEWGFLQCVALPNPDPANEFVQSVARQMNARLPADPPPAMWTHWYQFYHDIDEQLFLKNVDELAAQKTLMPFKVIELDDGYQSAWGDWTITNGRFPHGLEWLAEQIRAKGFTPGLWLAPFVVQRKSQLAQAHPDWLVKDRHGRPANAGFLYNMFIQALDLTHPEVLEHVSNLIDTLTHRWGFGMLKLDFVNAAALPGARLDAKQTRAEALRHGLETIRQAAGEETFLLGSGCPYGPAIGMVDAMRIGPDTAPSWTPYFHWLPWAGPLIRNQPSIPSLRNALRHAINLSSLHQRWWWNDPDCLLAREAGSRLTEAEVQSSITLVGLSGGLVISSDDLSKLEPRRLQWLGRLVPNLGLRGLPLEQNHAAMAEIYQLKLDNWGHFWQAVALFNWQDRPADCAVHFNELGFPPGAELHVFDYWSNEYLRTSAPDLTFAHMPAHGCKLLRVSEARKSPQLVGDTLHISMGKELETITVDEERLVIRTIDMGREVEGDLWFWLPKKPRGAMCNLEVVNCEDRGNGIYSVMLNFSRRAQVEICF